MKITKCDRCGAEIPVNDEYTLDLMKRRLSMEKKFDLCEKCKNIFIDDFMRGGWVVNDKTTL